MINKNGYEKKNLGVELIREESEVQGSVYQIEDSINENYYGFLVDEESVN